MKVATVEKDFRWYEDDLLHFSG